MIDMSFYQMTSILIGCYVLWIVYDLIIKRKIKLYLYKKNITKTKKQPKEENLKCPNCGHDEWYEGPGGGSFGNIKCGKCEKWYNNLGPFGLREIVKVIAFIIMLPSISYAQPKDTIPFNKDTLKGKVEFSKKPLDFSFGIGDSYFSTGYVDFDSGKYVKVMKTSDGRWEIGGDSISAIKLLWKMIDKANEQNDKLWKVVQSSVEYTNTVPDLFKQNTLWKKYCIELRKHGYQTTTRKPNKTK